MIFSTKQTDNLSLSLNLIPLPDWNSEKKLHSGRFTNKFFELLQEKLQEPGRSVEPTTKSDLFQSNVKSKKRMVTQPVNQSDAKVSQ